MDENCTIKILSAPFFIATKIEAYKGRGKSDGRTSQDFEDVIYLLENRENLWNELDKTEGELKTYLKTEFQLLIKNPNIKEWIECHIERSTPPATEAILKELNFFIGS